MKFNTNNQRSYLTDGHLEDISKITCFSIEPDYVELVANKMCNILLLNLFFSFVFIVNVLSMLVNAYNFDNLQWSVPAVKMLLLFLKNRR